LSLSIRSLTLAALAVLPIVLHAQHTAYGSLPQQPNMEVIADETPNDAHAMKQHYVVLVSLDGFRYDYPKEHGAPHMQDMMKIGATAPEGMIPSYPSLTFPNHWTLVTGLLPEHHGIVRNNFYDPVRKENYSYTDATKSSDGTWYGGVPLWSLAEQQGMRAATFLWPGSEATVAGHRPDDYVKFQDYMDGHVGVDQVITWLKLPAAKRPHFMTLYIAETDHMGHWYGPDSVEEREAVHIVDALMGELRARLDATGLPVDLVIVSDHGMTMSDNNWIQFDEYADLANVKTQDWLMYPETEAEKQRIYEEFQAHPDPRFKVYRQKDVPEHLHYTGNPRIGDPVAVVDAPYIAHVHKGTVRTDAADHGYDPSKFPEMKAFFLATGPDIRRGVTVDSFPNVDIYSFIARLLDLKTPPNDGELGPLKRVLKK
jgi:predicted AlkP superfamily pyrophosphatase or phosphodiesterase